MHYGLCENGDIVTLSHKTVVSGSMHECKTYKDDYAKAKQILTQSDSKNGQRYYVPVNSKTPSKTMGI